MSNTDYNKWEERYFQIVLAIVAGELANPHSYDVRALAMKPILFKADRILTLLKERETNLVQISQREKEA